MALRVLGYVLELYRDLEARGVVRPGSPRPPVLPVVIHNGEAPWRAPVAVAEMIALPPVPAAVRRDLASLQPAQRLHVVDFPTHRQDDLVPGNVVSLQIGFEYAQPEDYARLLPAVAELKDAGLRRTVWEWVALRARRQGMTLEEVDVEGTYFRSRIGDNFKRATQAWFAEGVEEGLRRGREQGLEQGREQGIEQGREQGIEQGREQGIEQGREQGLEQGREQGIERGLEQQRALLMRQVAAKFGADAPARVGPLLSRVADAASLAEVGEAVLVAATETELAARVEAVIAPAHRIGEPDDAPARDRHPRC